VTPAAAAAAAAVGGQAIIPTLGSLPQLSPYSAWQLGRLSGLYEVSAITPSVLLSNSSALLNLPPKSETTLEALLQLEQLLRKETETSSETTAVPVVVHSVAETMFFLAAIGLNLLVLPALLIGAKQIMRWVLGLIIYKIQRRSHKHRDWLAIIMPLKALRSAVGYFVAGLLLMIADRIANPTWAVATVLLAQWLAVAVCVYQQSMLVVDRRKQEQEEGWEVVEDATACWEEEAHPYKIGSVGGSGGGSESGGNGGGSSIGGGSSSGSSRGGGSSGGGSGKLDGTTYLKTFNKSRSSVGCSAVRGGRSNGLVMHRCSTISRSSSRSGGSTGIGRSYRRSSTITKALHDVLEEKLLRKRVLRIAGFATLALAASTARHQSQLLGLLATSALSLTFNFGMIPLSFKLPDSWEEAGHIVTPALKLVQTAAGFKLGLLLVGRVLLVVAPWAPASLHGFFSAFEVGFSALGGSLFFAAGFMRSSRWIVKRELREQLLLALQQGSLEGHQGVTQVSPGAKVRVDKEQLDAAFEKHNRHYCLGLCASFLLGVLLRLTVLRDVAMSFLVMVWFSRVLLVTGVWGVIGSFTCIAMGAAALRWLLPP
jgi:uncharacterized membrane protein YgcG